MSDAAVSKTLALRNGAPQPALTRFERRSIAALFGILALYTLPLLPAARGQYDALGSTLHAFFTVSLFTTAIIALLDVLSRRLTGTRASFGITDGLWYTVAAVLGGITIPIYDIFKQLVLPARGYPLDPYLAKLDTMLFLGHDPWTITHALLGSVPATAAIDSLYSTWMALMLLFPAIVVALVRGQEQRTRLLLCWLMVWMLVGSAAAWLFASAGPCFYESAIGPNPSFHALGQQLAHISAQAEAAGVPMGEHQFQPMLTAALKEGHYTAVGGISAMPSVHVTMATLFAIAAFQVGRISGWIMTAGAIVIWIGSIHLGWHYATDGIVGAAMMIALWRASAPAVRWLAGSPEDRLA